MQQTAQSFMGAPTGARNATACSHSFSLFLPFVQILSFIFFFPVATEFKGDRWVPIRIRPSFRNRSILLISCKKELYTLVVLYHLAGITENIQQFLIGSPRV